MELELCFATWKSLLRHLEVKPSTSGLLYLEREKYNTIILSFYLGDIVFLSCYLFCLDFDWLVHCLSFGSWNFSFFKEEERYLFKCF